MPVLNQNLMISWPSKNPKAQPMINRPFSIRNCLVYSISFFMFGLPAVPNNGPNQWSRKTHRKKDLLVSNFITGYLMFSFPFNKERLIIQSQHESPQPFFAKHEEEECYS